MRHSCRPKRAYTVATIDANTGLLAAAECTEVIQENYLSGTEPKESCSIAAHDWLLNLRQAPADVFATAFNRRAGKECTSDPTVEAAKCLQTVLLKDFLISCVMLAGRLDDKQRRLPPRAAKELIQCPLS